jgi:hypothetical protein
MTYPLKVLLRFPVSIITTMRNIWYEFWFSGKAADVFPGGEALRRNGFHVFAETLDSDTVEALKEDFRRLEQENPPAKTGQLAGRIYHHGAVSPLAERFIDRNRPLAEAYFGSKDIRCELTMYQRSWPIKTASEVPGGEFHVDDNKRNLKFFVYLTDVDMEHGPFCYVPGTHSFRGMKTLLRWWFWEVFRKRTFLYGFGLNNDDLEARAVPVQGPAGLCFCADTTGYHRATALKKGEREVFVVSFTRNLMVNI